jgi:hypothetical protein
MALKVVIVPVVSSAIYSVITEISSAQGDKNSASSAQKKQSFMAQGLTPQHNKRAKTIQNWLKKFKSAVRPWKTSACAPYHRTSGAYARLWGKKPARLPNGAFMKLVGLPTTIGSAPKSI